MEKNDFLSKKRKILIKLNSLDSTSSISTDKEEILTNQKLKLIIEKKILNEGDKKLIHNFINKIPKIIINEDINKKINLVLDLDNTLVYTTQYPISFKNKYVKDIIFKMIFKDENLEIIRYKDLIFIFKFREGLKYFFDNTKNFCNYYIYTASIKYYADEVVEIMKNKFNIKIKNVISKKKLDDNNYNKSLSNINLNSNNSIILDDEPLYWENNLSNLILSKKFYDYQIMIVLKKNYFKEFGECNFIYQNKKDQNQFIISKFKYKKNLKNIFFPFYVESNNYSEKYQLIYLSHFIQKIHYLYFNFNIDISISIKILRNDIFYNKYFSVSKNFDNYNKIIEMIHILGGNINNLNSSKDIIYVEKELQNNNDNKIIVSEEYIYDCFYMLNNFDEKDKYYHFRNYIEINE